MDTRKLTNLLKKNEGPKLDFKLRIELDTDSGKREIAKDVCAIANSRGGRGYIVVGVMDKSKILVGVDKENYITEEQLQQIISSRIEPPIPISVDKFMLEEKEIIVITIFDGGQKPYQVREHGSFYIRRGSTTDTMRKQELVSAFQENLSFNVETTPILRTTVSCLNYKLIDKYFNSKGIIVNDENKEFLLESSGIIVKDRETANRLVTLGGLLVFSDINSVYIPHNMVRIVNNISKKLEQIFVVQGNLMNIIDRSEEIIRKILPVNYPTYAVIAGLKNAVLYRDYCAFYKEIEIVIDRKSVWVISPGNLIKGENNPLKNIQYIKRNMWIYEKMITLDEKKRFIQNNRGFSIMKKGFKNIGKVKFVNSYESNTFKVIYPGVDSINKQKNV